MIHHQNKCLLTTDLIRLVQQTRVFIDRQILLLVLSQGKADNMQSRLGLPVCLLLGCLCVL